MALESQNIWYLLRTILHKNGYIEWRFRSAVFQKSGVVDGIM